MKKRILCVVLLVTWMMTMCAFSLPKRSRSDKGKEEAKTSQAADASILEDPVIQAHIENNKALLTREEVERKATEFRLYVANTETMLGFVDGTTVSQYQGAIQSAFDAAHTQFTTLNAYALGQAKGATELTWQRETMDEQLLTKLQSPDFYKDRPLPEVGPLTSMFRQGGSPFAENAVTMIISNFVEPSFDFNALSTGIEAYFDAYEQSAAALVAFHCDINNGKLYIPEMTNTKGRTTSYIERFTGEVPCYIVLVGPEASVSAYIESLSKYFDSRRIDAFGTMYTNSVYEQIIAPPLAFEVLADQKAKKAVAPLWSSYNSGTLTKSEYGNAYFATYSSVETFDGKAPRGAQEAGDQVPIGKSSQIALLSSNYDGVSTYRYKPLLYVYDAEKNQWEDAGKNATSMMGLDIRFADGEFSEEISGKTNVLLAEGRREVYLGAKLNFEDPSLLQRDKIYRLELQLFLNRQNPDAASAAETSELPNFSVSSADYYNVVSRLCKAWGDNYVWTGTREKVNGQPVLSNWQAQRALSRTPNLDALLVRLEMLETKYQPNDALIQYVDFVFNLPDADSKR